ATHGDRQRRRIATQVPCDLAQRSHAPLSCVPGDPRARQRAFALARIRQHVLAIDAEPAGHGLDDLLERELAAIDTQVPRQVLEKLCAPDAATLVPAAARRQA